MNTGMTLCPLCARAISDSATLCKRCGQIFRSMRLAGMQVDRYEIVPDGEQFAIAIHGEIKVEGL